MKPADILVIDIESTTADPNTARIVQLAITDLAGDLVLNAMFNPGCPIPAAATAVHRLTDADVADCLPFSADAADIQQIIAGKVLATYNGRRFDVPVLDREFRAAGQLGIDLQAVVEIDAYRAWLKLRPRTLAGALREWCGEELEDAHDALADCRATAKVITAMAIAAQDEALGDGLELLAALSRRADEVDRAGWFRRCPETGFVLFAKGKHRGKFAARHPDYIEWLGRQEWLPSDTHRHVRRFLAALEAA